MNQVKRIYRSTTNKMLGGVCQGLANYFNIDVTLVRIAWVVLTLMGGAGIFAYLLCWIIIPASPYGT